MGRDFRGQNLEKPNTATVRWERACTWAEMGLSLHLQLDVEGPSSLFISVFIWDWAYDRKVDLLIFDLIFKSLSLALCNHNQQTEGPVQNPEQSLEDSNHLEIFFSPERGLPERTEG